MNWLWKDYWQWIVQIENQEIALKEFGDTRWISNLPAENQVEVFKFAPEDVKERFAEYIKPSAKVKLGLKRPETPTQMDIAFLFRTRTKF